MPNLETTVLPTLARSVVQTHMLGDGPLVYDDQVKFIAFVRIDMDRVLTDFVLTGRRPRADYIGEISLSVKQESKLVRDNSVTSKSTTYLITADSTPDQVASKMKELAATFVEDFK